MNSLTRLYIKTALLFFIAALLVRLVQSLNSLWDISPLFTTLGPVYFHMFLVGWVTQLIFGMVYWMFPKYTLEKPRGSERLAWAVFGLLNLGLLLRVVSEPIHALSPSPFSGWMLAFSALFQWTAGMSFLANSWPRVKEK